MPVQRCQKDGEQGFKWGPSGVCFTGADARQRAAAVGRAIKAQESERTTQKSDEAAQHAIEVHVAGMTPDQLRAAGPLLPTEESADMLVDKAAAPVDLPADADGERRWVRKADDELRIVWGEVYYPDFPDSQGDFMTAREIQKMAYRFLAGGSVNKCDVNHDSAESGCFIVESFIARKDDPLFIPGAWVVGMHVPDEKLWQSVKKGEFNGFSLQARVLQRKVKIDLELPPEFSGTTEHGGMSETALHTHAYTVRFDANGQFLGGETSVADGHSHSITLHSVTDVADGHRHRFTFADALFGNRVPAPQFETATGDPLESEFGPRAARGEA